jgi:addiction module HigA family antidote
VHALTIHAKKYIIFTRSNKMQKNKPTPGTALNALIKKHGLNYNRVAKVIGLSSAMVRLIALDENPISSQVAFRLAKFFKTKPEYWLALQMEFDISQSAKDKKLAKILKDIPTVDKATFERKKKAKKAEKTVKKAKPAKKAKTAKPKAAKVKTAVAGKRGRPAKNGKPVVSAINEPLL